MSASGCSGTDCDEECITPFRAYRRRSCPTNSRRWVHPQTWLSTPYHDRSLAQNRYRGTGPKFIKHGSRVLYRWSDVLEWLDRNTIQRTDDPREQQ